MTLKALMESDLDDVFFNEDEFGVSVEYFPTGGGGKRTFTAALGSGPSWEIEKDRFHEVKRRVVTLLIKKSDTDGITEVKRGDSIKYLATHWDFDKVTIEDDFSMLIQWKQSKVINSGKVDIGV